MIKEEVKKWLRMAKDDLDSAKVNFDNGKYYVCVFLCQQAVEKGLKALLIKKTGSLLKIHDLIILGRKVNLPEGILNECDKINAIYLDARYGDIGGKIPSEKFDKAISSEFLKSSREILKWLKQNI